MRAAVAEYHALLEPVRPEKFYGQQLTPVRCVSFMKGRDARLDEGRRRRRLRVRAVGLVDAGGPDPPGAGPRPPVRRRTVPTSCTGEIGYWDVRSGGGDTYVVRAAVLDTLAYGRWDAVARTLTGTGSISYDEASAYDYTLRKADGVWKVIDVHGTGLSFTRGGSHLHPDSA